MTRGRASARASGFASATAAQAALNVSLARITTMIRSAWTVAIAVLAWVQYEADGPSRRQVTLIVGAVVAWGVVHAVMLRRHGFAAPGRVVVVADALLFVACLALADQVLPSRLVGDNSTWLVGGASIAIFLTSWVSTTPLTLAIAVSLSLAYLTGVAAAGTGFGVPHYQQAFVFLLQGGLAVGILRLMRRGAADADASLVHLERARAGLSVERARLHNRRALERTLHDTVLSTLTAVARGGLADHPEAVRARCARDLARLDEIDGEPGRPAPADATASEQELGARIGLEVDCSTLSVQVRAHPGPADPILPESVVTALVGAVGEALSNVERHAGSGAAEIDTWTGPGHVEVVVRDSGRGFDPTRVRPDATGIRRSVRDRLEAVGGSAAVGSSPGRGTVVRLRWDAPAPESPAPEPAPAAARPEPPPAPGQLSEASTIDLTRVLVVIALAWHLFCGAILVIHYRSYTALPLNVAGWVVIIAVLIAAGRRLGDRPGVPIVLGGQGVLFLAAVVSTATVPASQQLLGANWVVADVGWPLAVLAIHRPLREYLLWNAGLVVVYLGYVAQAPGAGPAGLGKAVSVLLCALVLQVSALVAHGILRRDNTRAEEAVRQLTGVMISQQTLTAAARERYRWRREIGASLRPLVRSLADGTADPSDPQIRSRCAIEASRLRAAITVLSESGEHSRWRRGVVEALTRAALARGSTLEVRITPEFETVAEEIRGELVNAALATLPMSGAGAAVVTLSGPVPDASTTASVTVLFTLPVDADAVRRAVAALLDRVRATLSEAVVGVEEPEEGRLWLEVRSPALLVPAAGSPVP